MTQFPSVETGTPLWKRAAKFYGWPDTVICKHGVPLAEIEAESRAAVPEVETGTPRPRAWAEGNAILGIKDDAPSETVMSPREWWDSQDHDEYARFDFTVIARYADYYHKAKGGK